MRYLTASAICALLAATPALAQTGQGVRSDQQNVYRNDLPETHDRVSLPQVKEASGSPPEQAVEALRDVARGSFSAQQFGNLAGAKSAGGAVRDLGDRMVLLHEAVDARLDQLGEAGPEIDRTMPEEDQRTLERLGRMNATEFNLSLSEWVRDAYPAQIEAWRSLADDERFGELSEAVVSRLEEQLQVAEMVADAGGDPSKVDESSLPGMRADAQASGSGPTGAEGQTGERQHTPAPEAPAVQDGSNYAHAEVETDRPAEAASGDAAAPARNLAVLNSAGIFMTIVNLDEEMDQLEALSDLRADRVKVVAAEDVLAAADLETAQRAASDNEESLKALRKAIESHPALGDAVSGAQADPADVIAMDVTDEGVVLYTFGGT